MFKVLNGLRAQKTTLPKGNKKKKRTKRDRIQLTNDNVEWILQRRINRPQSNLIRGKVNISWPGPLIRRHIAKAGLGQLALGQDLARVERVTDDDGGVEFVVINTTIVNDVARAGPVVWYYRRKLILIYIWIMSNFLIIKFNIKLIAFFNLNNFFLN